MRTWLILGCHSTRTTEAGEMSAGGEARVSSDCENPEFKPVEHTKTPNDFQPFPPQHNHLATSPRLRSRLPQLLLIRRSRQHTRLSSRSASEDVALVGGEDEVGLGVERGEVGRDEEGLFESLGVPDCAGRGSADVRKAVEEKDVRLTVPSPPRLASWRPSAEKTRALVIVPFS